ncbi:MAG: DUF5668 domain-containing protein [Bacillota bacterium]|nr:DUF5668 domain-containing protein [Bacillota bacterium]
MGRREGGSRGRLGGAVLILLGVILLLANLGYLTVETWEALARFWPVLLMLAGLDLLIRGNRLGWVAPALVLLLGAVLLLSTLGPTRREWELPGPWPSRRVGALLRVRSLDRRDLLYRPACLWTSNSRAAGAGSTSRDGGGPDRGGGRGGYRAVIGGGTLTGERCNGKGCRSCGLRSGGSSRCWVSSRSMP